MPSQDSAKERFFRHFHSSVARDEFQPADIPQIRRADELERSGEITVPFPKITLKGNYQPPAGSENDLGGCLRRSIREAMNLDVENLPDVVDPKDLPDISAELGLTFYTGKQRVLLPKDRDIIILYQTGGDSAHAIVTNDLPKFSKRGKTIVGILEMPNK